MNSATMLMTSHNTLKAMVARGELGFVMAQQSRRDELMARSSRSRAPPPLSLSLSLFLSFFLSPSFPLRPEQPMMNTNGTAFGLGKEY
jgi:hypothetical protein